MAWASDSWVSSPGSLVSLMGDEGSAVPEMIEIELYRQLAERTVGRRVREVVAPDAWFLKGVVAAELAEALTGERITAADRHGKLLLGREEVVEAPLADVGDLADLVDAHVCVAARVPKASRRLDEPFLRVHVPPHRTLPP